MNGLPYYKRYPRDFIEGTIGLPFELKTTYAFLLDLIYAQGGTLRDDARYISGLLGVSLRKWSSLRSGLIDAGKIAVSGEFLTNFRANIELEITSKLQDKQSENRARPNKINDLQSPKANHTDTDTEDTIVSSKGDKAAQTRLRKIQFDAFWGVYPRLAGKGAAEKAFNKALEADAFEDIMAGAKRYSAQRQGQDAQYTKHPATWLNQKCWLDGLSSSGAYVQQPMRRGQYRIMRNGEVQHRNDEHDDWYQIDVAPDTIASIAIHDYRRPLEAVG